MVKDFDLEAKPREGSAAIRCDICLAPLSSRRVQRCRVCGQNLCADHYLAGMCPDHFHALDATQQTQLHQHFATWKNITRRVHFGIISVSILAILFGILVGAYIITYSEEQWIPIGKFFLFLGVPFFVLVWLCLRWSKKAAIAKAQILAFIIIVERLQNVGTVAERSEKMEEVEDYEPDDSNAQPPSRERNETK